MAWAFATWSVLDAALMALVISRARDIDLSCQDVANLYWAFAKLLVGDGLTAMEAAALPKISRFNTQELSSIAWASATQLSCDSQLVSAIAEEAARRGEGGEIFGPQSLSNLSWSFARAADANHVPLMEQLIAPMAIAQIAEFGAQSLANTA